MINCNMNYSRNRILFNLTLLVLLPYACTLSCTKSGHNINAKQICKCEKTCPNEYNENKCTNVIYEKLQLSMADCKNGSCSKNYKIQYNHFCKPLSCKLLYTNGSKYSDLTNTQCLTLPCIAGCECGATYMQCVLQRMTKAIDNIVIPYKKIQIVMNYLAQFPIDTSILQPWISFVQLTTNRIFSENLNPEVFKNLPNLRHLDLTTNFLTTIHDDTFKNLKVLRFLYLNRNFINTISKDAFRGLVNLEKLSIAENPISQLPQGVFEHTPQLIDLSIRSTFLISLERKIFKPLRNLKGLYARNSHIRVIENGTFSNLLSLNSIELSSNKIRSINRQTLQNLKFLQNLNLQGNPITAFERNFFSDMKNITTINLAYTDINDLARGLFHEMPSLKSLNIASRRQRYLNCGVFSKLPRLNYLKAENCGIQTICDGAFKELSNLKTLILSSNALKALSNQTFYGLISLVKLDLNDNRIQQFPLGVFSNLVSLQEINLNRNTFREIDESICNGPRQLKYIFLEMNRLEKLNVDALSNCSNSLKTLRADKNFITHINASTLLIMRSLTSLSLKSNLISSISPLLTASPLPELKKLSLKYTYVTTLKEDSLLVFRNIEFLEASSMNLADDGGAALSQLSNLDSLNIAACRIHSNYSFSHHPKLKYLDLSHVGPEAFRLERHKFKGLSDLMYLYLNLNNISAVRNTSFPFLSSLIDLHLEANLIKIVEPYSFNMLPALRSLSLARNKIKTLVSNQFNSLLNLAYLNLSSNSISTIEEAAFNDLPNLNIVYFDFNYITTLSEKMFASSVFLSQLHIYGNRLREIDLRIFNNQHRLRYIDLKMNQLQVLKHEVNTVKRKPWAEATMNLNGNKLAIDNIKAFKGTTLNQLAFNKNNIKELNSEVFKDIPNLQFIHFRINFLTSLPENLFQNLQKVTYLDLTINGLTSVDFAVFTELKLLRIVLISYNYITILLNTQKSKMIEIRNLYLEGNIIQKLQDGLFSNFPLLFQLGLGYNRLKRIPNHFCNGTKLMYIELQMNQIDKLRRLQFAECEYVRSINLTKNLISTLHSNIFADMKSLQEIWLGHNRIEYLETHIFSSYSPLHLVNLTHNRITKIDNRAFSNLSSLEQLFLGENRLKAIPISLFPHIPYLRILKLESNDITEIPDFAFKTITSLGSLELANNKFIRLKENSFHGLQNLASLRLDHNQHLQSIDFRLFNKFLSLRNLSMRFCNLNASIVKRQLFQKISTAHSLFLDGNNLIGIDETLIDNISQLKSLSLSHTKIPLDTVASILSKKFGYRNVILAGLAIKSPDVLFKVLTGAIRLDLENNEVEGIDQQSLLPLHSLRILRLAGNRLRDKDYATLLTLTGLEYLSLSRNKLVNVCIEPEFNVSLTKLKALDLDDNNIYKLDANCFNIFHLLINLNLRNNPIIQYKGDSFYGLSDLRMMVSNREYLCCAAPESIISCNPLPNQFKLSTCSHLLSHTVLRLLVWIIGTIAIIGNIVSIIWHLKIRKQDMLIVKTLITNLSIADLLMGFYLILIASANLFYSQRYSEYLEVWLRSALCLIASFLVSLSSLMSTFVLLLITIDRYLYFTYPFFDYRLSYKANAVTLLALWSISIIFTGIPILYSVNQPAANRLYGTTSVCLPSNIRNQYLLIWLLSFCGTTFVTWVAITIMYVVIVIEIIRSRKLTQSKISLEDNIIILKMISIVATDLICWMPLYIVIIRVFFGQGFDMDSLSFIATMFLPLNSCINPILYTIFTKKFIKYARIFLMQRWCHNCLTIYCNHLPSTSDGPGKDYGPHYYASISVISNSVNISKQYLKVKLCKADQSEIYGLIKAYNENERECWEREKEFYKQNRSKQINLINTISCLWFCEGHKFRSPYGRSSSYYGNRWMVCYELVGEDMCTLDYVIKRQLIPLRPSSTLQIVQDIVRAIKSLHSCNIVHRHINAESIFIGIYKQDSMITTRLGGFTSALLLSNKIGSSKYNDENKLMAKDIADLGKLCSDLSLYCQTKALELSRSSELSLANQKSSPCNLWTIAQTSLMNTKIFIENQQKKDISIEKLADKVSSVLGGYIRNLQEHSQYPFAL